MELISDQEILQAAVTAALNSTCTKAKCGSVIVAGDELIGAGFNSPAGGEPARCQDSYLIPDNNKHDITCCVHAEIRAIRDAQKNNPERIAGAKLYFIRLDENGAPTAAGTPYCTLCSREALDSGIAEFGLWKNNGFEMYNTQDYNNLTYQFFKDKNLWNLK